MPPRRKFLRRRGLAFCLLALLALAWALVVHPYLRIAAGYSATVGAMQHFATGDSLERIRRERLPSKIGFVSLSVDEEARAVEARALYVTSRAVYREGLGATREETRRAELPEALSDLVEAPPPGLPWPAGSSTELAALDPEIDAGRLEAALQWALEEGRGTHAVAVAHRGRLVAERYAEPYGPSTPLLGWSMTKSVTATLLGRLVNEGRLNLDAPAAVEPWRDTPREAIRVEDLLRMRSGLEFYQDHATPFCDSLHMLFLSGDCGGFAAARPLAHEVGSHWAYSDGTSNILASLVLDAGAADLPGRLELPARLLFAPLGMDTAFIAVDGRGNFVGSSLMYASARDWARFGQLQLDDGIWSGQRLLPAGWVDLVTRPTPGSDGRFGAHFWLERGELLDGVFSAQGYESQLLYVDRARRVVLVRLGVGRGVFEERRFAREVLGAFPVEGQDRRQGG